MDRVESPEIDPHKYSQLIFDKRTKQCNGVNIVIYANGAGTAGNTQAKKKKKPTPQMQTETLNPSQKLTQNGLQTYM